VQNMMFLLLFFGGGSTIVSILLNCRGRKHKDLLEVTYNISYRVTELASFNDDRHK
jgi:hypothetical protein